MCPTRRLSNPGRLRPPAFPACWDSSTMCVLVPAMQSFSVRPRQMAPTFCSLVCQVCCSQHRRLPADTRSTPSISRPFLTPAGVGLAHAGDALAAAVAERRAARVGARAVPARRRLPRHRPAAAGLSCFPSLQPCLRGWRLAFAAAFRVLGTCLESPRAAATCRRRGPDVCRSYKLFKHCPQERDEARAALETAAAAAPVANGKRAADEDIEQPTKKVILLLILFFHGRMADTQHRPAVRCGDSLCQKPAEE